MIFLKSSCEISLWLVSNFECSYLGYLTYCIGLSLINLQGCTAYFREPLKTVIIFIR